MAYNSIPVPTMASLFARINAPRDRLDFNAAIGSRASRLTTRLRPLPPVAHGFYDPAGFIASCNASAARNQFYRDAIRRIAAREAARGRGFAA